jgi:hypothetical protein
LHLAGGDVVQHAPVVYQDGDGGRVPVAGAYVLHGDGTVGVSVGAYDAARPLVIDPVLGYSTYLGGSGAFNYSPEFESSGIADDATGIAVDGAGNAYVTGYTYSTDFPILNPFQGSSPGAAAPFNSPFSAFVTKLNAAGQLVYSTYLGGNGYTYANAIAVDGAGEAHVTGITRARDFPTLHAVQTDLQGKDATAFLTKLNAAGNALVYSTYFGSNQEGQGNSLGSSFGFDFGEQGNGIALDGAGNAYVTGTILVSFVSGIGNDAFVTKFGPAGDQLYSTSLSKFGFTSFAATSTLGFGIAVDGAGNAYLTGAASQKASFNSATHSSLQPAYGGGLLDAFVAKVNATGTALDYLSWLGGSAEDVGYGIAVDGSGNAYVAGTTKSLDFPTVNPLQATNRSYHGPFTLPFQGTDTTDAFVAKVNAAGNALVYSTYLGGIADDGGPYGGLGDVFGQLNASRPIAVAVDGAGNAYLAGTTTSTDFPTVNPLQAAFGGGNGDAYVAKLSPSGSALLFSTFLGGSQTDEGNALAVDGVGNIYVAGVTYASDFPTANALQGSRIGSNDAFVTKILAPQPLTYTVPADNQPHALVLGVGGATLQLLDNGVAVGSQLLANTSAVVVTATGSGPVVLSVDNSAGLITVADGIYFDGGPGGGILLLVGTPAANAFALTPAFATLNNSQVVAFVHVSQVTALGNPGDSAALFDAPGDNTLVGTPSYATLLGTGFRLTAADFPSVSAFAGTGRDAALLFDSAGSNLFVATPAYAYVQAGASVNLVSGFAAVQAVSGGGGDLALLYDSAGANVFAATPTYSSLGGTGFLNVAVGFTQVRASSSSGADIAFLMGNDVFRGTPDYGFLATDNSLNLVTGFAVVTAPPSAGGNSAPVNDTVVGQGGSGPPTDGATNGGAANGSPQVPATSSTVGVNPLAGLDFAFAVLGS